MAVPKIEVKWTQTAADALRNLPPKARKSLLHKSKQLETCGDPRQAGKPLVGPLKGYYRITCGRYRAIYGVSQREEKDGTKVLTIVIVTFVLAGQRKDGDKSDIYELATKLVSYGIISPASNQPAKPTPPPTSHPRHKRK